MTKLFWVNKVKAQAPSETHQIRHITHEWHEEAHEEVEEKYEEVEAMDESSHGVHDVDIGQIAVDVLDLSDEIIIVAPIAWVDPSDIDIALSRNILTLSWESLAFNKIRATVEENVIMVHIPKLSFFSKTIKVEK